MSGIRHEISGNRGLFYYEQNGERLAEMVYVIAGESRMIIEHTEVDDSLRGKGVGKKLLEELVKYVRANNIDVIPLCPFANATFQKTKEWQDVLKKTSEN